MVAQFSENFTILLFHYDGKTTEWDQFEWSKRAIHVSARKQAKWSVVLYFFTRLWFTDSDYVSYHTNPFSLCGKRWYAKRFLHPDIVAPYDYIFIWDEDLGVENFDSEKLALFLYSNVLSYLLG